MALQESSIFLPFVVFREKCTFFAGVRLHVVTGRLYHKYGISGFNLVEDICLAEYKRRFCTCFFVGFFSCPYP